jgi:hypothetical protein
MIIIGITLLHGIFLSLLDACISSNERKIPQEFGFAINESELAEFGFGENFLFDMWGAISDGRDGRFTALY